MKARNKLRFQVLGQDRGGVHEGCHELHASVTVTQPRLDLPLRLPNAKGGPQKSTDGEFIATPLDRETLNEPRHVMLLSYTSSRTDKTRGLASRTSRILQVRHVPLLRRRRTWTSFHHIALKITVSRVFVTESSHRADAGW